MARTARDLGDVSAKHRNALKLFTMKSQKTRKGEAAGYLTAILYLSPHTSGGGVTLCPYSTPACREMCLAGAGLSGLPLQVRAKQKRTDWFNADPQGFIGVLSEDIVKLVRIAKAEGLKPAVRLNGTSDVIWERIAMGLFISFPDVELYDYTKIPLRLRQTAPRGYHLTFSVEGPDSMALAVQYLREGRGVAIVVPEEVKKYWTSIEPQDLPLPINIVDGDAHDLRFLDPPSAVVLLKPKGRIETSLIRPDFMGELISASMLEPAGVEVSQR